jgi:hypothetical protein
MYFSLKVYLGIQDINGEILMIQERIEIGIFRYKWNLWKYYAVKKRNPGVSMIMFTEVYLVIRDY